MNGSIYLCGSMQFAPAGDLGASWRASCAKVLRAMDFDPLDITNMDVQYNANHSKDIKCSLNGVHTLPHKLQTKSNIRRHFIDADLSLIKNHADALIVVYDDGVRKGAGTISECQFAYNNDIPIFLVNTYPTDQDIPGWLYGLTTRVFSSFDDLYSYLTTLPPGILKKDTYGNRRSGNSYLCSLCGAVEEKHGAYFVSKVSPSYCKRCVEIVKHTHEQHMDRYQFFLLYLEEQEAKARSGHV